MFKEIFANIYESKSGGGSSCFSCDASCHCECDGSSDPCNWGG